MPGRRFQKVIIAVQTKDRVDLAIPIDYQLKQRVKIPEINREGIVTAIMLETSGVMYHIRYFDNGKPETVWFYNHELLRIG